MAADRTLIEGTYRAAMADSEIGLAKSKAVSTISKDLTKQVTDYLDKKTEEGENYEELAQNVLNEIGDLPQSEFGKIYDELQLGKYDYIWGDKKSKALSIRDLNVKRISYADYSNLRTDLATWTKDDTEGLSNHFRNSDIGKAYMDLLKDKPRLVAKKCNEGEEDCVDKGKMGVMIPDHEKGTSTWMSISAIRQELEKNLIDTGFRGRLKDIISANEKKSAQVKEGQIPIFPKKFTENKIKEAINNSTNSNSISYDKMFGETSFHEDLVQRLVGEKWKNLGIDVSSIDPNTDGKDDTVSPEDADFIARELIDNEEYKDFKINEQVKYFTGFASQNFDHAAELRIKNIKNQDGGDDGDFPLDFNNEDEFIEVDNRVTAGSPENFITLTDDKTSKLNNLINMKFDNNNEQLQRFLSVDKPKNKKIKEILLDENLSEDEKFQKLIDEDFMRMPIV